MFRRSLTFDAERRDPVDLLLLCKALWIINGPISQFILLLKNTMRKLVKKKLLVDKIIKQRIEIFTRSKKLDR